LQKKSLDINKSLLFICRGILPLLLGVCRFDFIEHFYWFVGSVR
jgi:uncharacterized membrane protein YuzA (DUF378 family)